MTRVLFATLFVMLAGAETLEAQRRGPGSADRMQDRARIQVVPEVGIRGAYDFDARDFGIGAQAQFPLSRLLRFVPSADFFFADGPSWQANGDVALSLLVLRAGGGIGLVHGVRTGTDPDETEVGLNLFAGLQAPPRRGSVLRPYAEARWTFLEGATPFSLAAGVNLRLRGPAANDR